MISRRRFLTAVAIGLAPIGAPAHAQEYDRFASNITKVAQIAKSLGPKFEAWLDESGAGNDPRTCMILLAYPDMKLSKSQAQTELTKLMGTKEYLQGDKQTVVRAEVLGRIAHSEAGEPQPTRRLSVPSKPVIGAIPPYAPAGRTQERSQ